MQGTNHATWELKLIVGLIVALSAAADVAAFQRFAPSLGLPAWTGALCVLPVKLVEWRFLTFAARLSRSGFTGKVLSPVCAFVWTLALGLSALAAHSTIYTLLASSDRNTSKRVETRANLVTAMERVNGQLAAIQKPLPRPAKTLEQELGWAISVSAPPRNCARAADEAAREACKRVMDLRKELAAATEFERLVRQADTLREKLAGLDIEAARDPMPQVFEATIGRVVELDGKNGIATMGMLILTLVSALGPFALDTLRCNQACPARPVPTHPAEGEVSNAGRREGTAQVFQFRSERPGQARGRAPGQAPYGGRAAMAAGASDARPAGARQARGGQSGTPRADGEGTRGQRRGNEQAEAAVAQFVGMLAKGKGVRASGSALYDAYTRQRLVHGWPSLQPNVFGVHLKTAVIKSGGRKLKSGVQIYEGVAVPASWAADGVAASARAA